ncbi:MAG: hypothetical protein AAGB27_01880 [Pseudomonadota bacterium]
MAKHWNWRQRSIAVIVWPSFLMASVATLLFFAKIDPALLLAAFVFQVEMSNQAVYSLGFFFFWLICAGACTLSTWLIRTERRMDSFPEVPPDLPVDPEP